MPVVGHGRPVKYLKIDGGRRPWTSHAAFQHAYPPSAIREMYFVARVMRL